MVTETVPVVGSDQLLPRAQGWFAAYWSAFHKVIPWETSA